MQGSFHHIRALLDYASNDTGNESSIYGAASFILTLFCTSASVTATRFKNLYLGCFPQKDLKKPKKEEDSKKDLKKSKNDLKKSKKNLKESRRSFRAPDFTVIVVQSDFDGQSTQEKFENVSPLIWEVKASQGVALTWFGGERSKPPKPFEVFFQHFHQITAQVEYAKAKFNRRPIYVLLSVDIWFVLLHFPGETLSVGWTMSKEDKLRVDPADYFKFYECMVVALAPMVNEECTSFSPEFLYALQVAFDDLSDVTVTPHPFFRAPGGLAEFISTHVCHLHFSPLEY